MTEPKIKTSKVLTRETLHLSGGLRARIISTDGHLSISQSRNRQIIALPAVKKNYVAAIRVLGLDLIGVETETIDKDVRHWYWDTYQHGTPITETAGVTWRHIAFAAHENGTAMPQTWRVISPLHSMRQKCAYETFRGAMDGKMSLQY